MENEIQLEFDEREIALGDSQKDIKAREIFIIQLYKCWERENPDKRIYNESLKDFIYVNSEGKRETTHHAARTCLSTLALFHLSDILKNAEFVTFDETKSKRQKKSFEKMIIMKRNEYKLTVGVTKTENKKIQYCIALIE